jgi:hypothetical protein
MTTSRDNDNLERDDLLGSLGKQRGFLRQTVQGLTDHQAVATPTASELCLGGLIKHVALVEDSWADFIEHGPRRSGPVDQAAMDPHAAGFRLLDGETLAWALGRYEEVAQRTDKLVNSLPSLDASHPLSEAPWFEPGAQWSARRTLLHIIAETAQHAGHPDIIRETIDGAKTMG